MLNELLIMLNNTDCCNTPYQYHQQKLATAETEYATTNKVLIVCATLNHH